LANADLERFRLKVREYRLMVNRNQSDLAAYLNLDYNELSNRLNTNKNARLSHDNVRGVVRALAEWGAITTRAQAEELLDLVLCPHFDPVDWQARPLFKLTAPTASTIPSLPEAPVVSPTSPLITTNQQSAISQPKFTGIPATLHNLPQQLSSFIGRQKEVTHLKKLLVQDKARLLTLVGTGGCGKTRLSLQVASQVIDNFQDGVWFVELAPLSDSTLIAQIVATTLGLSEQAGRPILITLSEYLRSRHLLLVLDNCEHLLEECLQLVANLLRASSNLQILASSREALGLNGETTFLVPSLTLPNSQELPAVDNLPGYEAVRLFIERAGAANPNFVLTQENAPEVVNLCQHLDGIPLAIELAAARIKVLTVEQVAARLDDRFRLLTGGSRAVLKRQQTLRALVDWSYELLSPVEKRLLARLSVFAGSWALEAAVAVAGNNENGADLEEYAVLDALTGLVNKSLVQVSEFEDKAEARYSFLETIRQYGLEKLKITGEEDEVRRRHLAYYTGLAEELGIKLISQDQVKTIQRLDRELENVRTAIRYGQNLEKSEIVDKTSTPNLFLHWDIGGNYSWVFQLTANLFLYWDVRGYYSEGRRYFEQMLSLPNATGISRALTLFFGGFLSVRQGDLKVARFYYEEGLTISNEFDDEELWGQAFTCMGILNYNEGNYAEARNYLEKSLAVHLEMFRAYQTSGQHNAGQGLKVPFWKASSQNNLCLVLIELGEYAQARRLYDEALATTRELGNRWAVILILVGRTKLALAEEDYSHADDYLAEVFSLSEAMGFRLGKLAALIYLGMSLYHQDKFKESSQNLEEGLVMSLKVDEINESLEALVGVADLLSKVWLKIKQMELLVQVACLCGAISALQTYRGEALGVPFRSYYVQALEISRSGLKDTTFEASFNEGQTMPLEEAIDYARQALAGI
jgi:predicted ATPase